MARRHATESVNGLPELIAELRSMPGTAEAVAGLTYVKVVGTAVRDGEGRPVRHYAFTLDARGRPWMNGTGAVAILDDLEASPRSAKRPTGDLFAVKPQYCRSQGSKGWQASGSVRRKIKVTVPARDDDPLPRRSCFSECPLCGRCGKLTNTLSRFRKLFFL